MFGEISRDEVRSAIEDKLCAHFAVSGDNADDGQIFQATAMVIREIMSRFLAADMAAARSLVFSLKIWTALPNPAIPGIFSVPDRMFIS